MAWFDWLTGLFTGPGASEAPPPIEPVEINPATGLPMTGGIGSVDVGGNPYGIDLHRHEDYAHHLTHDHWNDWSSPAGGHDSWRDW